MENKFDFDKYYLALGHESPDAVLGSLMSDFDFKLNLNGIRDACDWYYLSHNQNDQQVISKSQPMFYNVHQHRPVTRHDVIKILKKLQMKK